MSGQHVRAQLFHILHKPSPANPVARWANYLLALLIVANALCVSIETVPQWSATHRAQFLAFEVISTGLFALEYAARLWTCVEQQRYAAPIRGRLRYALSPLALLDLIVVATFWLPVDLRFLRVARLVRLLKLFRLDHFEASLSRIADGLRRRRALMTVSVTMMVLSIYCAAALLYQVEHQAQAAVFTSIPATLWWALETLTTIGYGDMVPITPLGKVCAGLISVFGIGIFALPTAIVTAAILEAGVSDPDPVICHHCGRKAHAEPH